MPEQIVKVLDSVKDYAEWNDIIEGLEIRDLYYSADFAILSSINFGNISRLFYFSNEYGVAVFPFVQRLINTLPFFDDKNLWWDVISPEYGGIVVRGSPEIIFGFQDAFHKWCLENNVVAEYVRCSPLLETARWYPEAKPVKEIIYIDLKSSVEKIFSSFQKKCRQNCRNAEKRGVTVRETREKSDIEEFHRLYISTMDRHKARGYSYLRPSFFENILWFLKKNSKLYVAEHGEKIIAGSIVLFKDNIAYDYYRASSIEHESLRPSNLLVWQIIKYMKNENCDCFVMGSGYKPNDGVFIFKETFSKLKFNYFIYTKIHNIKVYEKLCQLKKNYDTQNKLVSDKEFFPLYRG